MPKRHIDLLIDELGSELGLPGMRLGEDDVCTIETENGLEIVLNYIEDEQALVTYADLGRIPKKTREQVYSALLKGNFGWQNSRGTTLSTTAKGKRAVLQSYVPIDQCDVAKLVETLDHFSQWASLWADIVKDIEPGETGSPEVARPIDPSAFA